MIELSKYLQESLKSLGVPLEYLERNEDDYSSILNCIRNRLIENINDYDAWLPAKFISSACDGMELYTVPDNFTCHIDLLKLDKWCKSHKLFCYISTMYYCYYTVEEYLSCGYEDCPSPYFKIEISWVERDRIKIFNEIKVKRKGNKEKEGVTDEDHR